jgi:Secretion system C-terminal sorting domain
MKKLKLFIYAYVLAVFILIQQSAKAQCICTLPNYGCGIGQQNLGCVMACAYQCHNTGCIGTALISASDSLNFSPGDSVTLTATRTGATSYQWMRDSINIQGATSHTYVVYSSGIYKCRVTTTCNSKYTPALTVNVSISLGILEPRKIANLSIFPNPFYRSTTIKFYLSSGENISLRIFDMKGCLVKTIVSGMFSAGNHALEWDAEDIQPGVYLLRFEEMGKIENKRLIIG